MPDARELLRSVDHVVPHTDADGLAAGAIALRARGEDAGGAVLLRRGEIPFGPAPPLPPGSVAVLDWGVRELARPGLIVDHHAPEATPCGDQVLLSGYGEQPEVTTSMLMRRIEPDAPAWLASLGAFGDLGSRGGGGALRKLTPLVNAPRRLPDGPVREALAILVEAESAEAALADPRVRLLEAARTEWQSDHARVRKVPPRVGERAALIRFSSPYQLHPLVAAQWARRLSPRIVIAANDDYLPGRVNFAARGGSGDLRAHLRDALPGAEGEFAHGHDRATGGSLSPGDFERLVVGLGLD